MDCSPHSGRSLVQYGLDLQMAAASARYYLKWGSFNAILLSILLVDVRGKCGREDSIWYYMEVAATGLLSLSVLACFAKYFGYVFNKQPLRVTEEQRQLLTNDDNDSSFITTPAAEMNLERTKQSEPDFINSTLYNWDSSFNDYPMPGSPSWNYRITPQPRQSLSPQDQHDVSLNNSLNNNSSLNISNNLSFNSPSYKYRGDDVITDEASLHRYLKDVSRREYSMTEYSDLNPSFHDSSIGAFWNYCNSAANMLKSTLYQLAPSPAPPTQNTQASKDECGINIGDSNSEVIKRISSDKLARYVGDLRTWLSYTILQRLANEIKSVDEMLRYRGINDMQLGAVGLERLKKTVENQQIAQAVPMLPMIVPFLEICSNQEYLVQRIKDLAKGSCLAEYRWNSGAQYHGCKWDEHLPTDSAILFHLFCVYMDTQLMPLPQGGGRPFFSRYVIMGEEKRSAKATVALVQNKARCAILCSNPLKPKFNFISDGVIHNCAFDRNNLFYVIIQFLIYMRANQESCLEGVYLGKSGINIMCVIED